MTEPTNIRISDSRNPKPGFEARLAVGQTIISDTEFAVILDIGSALDWRKIARAIHVSPAARAAWITLARHPQPDSLECQMALGKIMAALELSGTGMVTLPPEVGESLGQGLILCALETPPLCTVAEGCGNYGSSREGEALACTEHASPDEYDEYEAGREH